MKAVQIRKEKYDKLTEQLNDEQKVLLEECASVDE